MSQQEHVASVSAGPDGTASVAAPASAAGPPLRPSAPFWGRFAIPLSATLVALAFVALATARWNEWIGDAVIQSTDDAYVRADLTRLSSRVSGEVLTVAVQDYQRVKAGIRHGKPARHAGDP